MSELETRFTTEENKQKTFQSEREAWGTRRIIYPPFAQQSVDEKQESRLSRLIASRYRALPVSHCASAYLTLVLNENVHVLQSTFYLSSFLLHILCHFFLFSFILFPLLSYPLSLILLLLLLVSLID